MVILDPISGIRITLTAASGTSPRHPGSRPTVEPSRRATLAPGSNAPVNCAASGFIGERDERRIRPVFDHTAFDGPVAASSDAT
jgi:hypothetical protein